MSESLEIEVPPIHCGRIRQRPLLFMMPPQRDEDEEAAVTDAGDDGDDAREGDAAMDAAYTTPLRPRPPSAPAPGAVARMGESPRMRPGGRVGGLAVSANEIMRHVAQRLGRENERLGLHVDVDDM